MKNFILVVSYLLPFLLFAQTQPQGFTTSAGTPYLEVSGREHEYFSDDMGNCILVKTDGEKVIIQHYDVTSMKEISRREYIDFPNGSKTEKCLKTGNHLFYLYSAPNKTKTRTLYAREINKTTGEFMKVQLLFETKGPVEFIHANEDGIQDLYDISTHFEVEKSFDCSKILIHYKREPISNNKDTNFEVIGLYAFDTNLAPLWGSEKTMPYTEKKQHIISYTIEKNGRACMLAFTNDGANLQYEFFSTSQNDPIQKTKLDIDPTMLLGEIKMTENSEGNINCTGYYNNGIDKEYIFEKPDLLDILFLNPVSKPQGSDILFTKSINGVFRATISPFGILQRKYMHEFYIEFINKYESQSAAKKNDKKEEKKKAGIADLLLQDVIENADGSTLIIGEQKYVRLEKIVKDVTNPNQSTLNGRTTTETTRLNYTKNIVVTKLDASGQISWQIKLPKYQLSYTGFGSIGFKYIEVDGMSYFIFLDNLDGTTFPDNMDPFLFQLSDGGELFAYKVDNASGKYINQVIFDTHNVGGTEVNQLPTVRIFNADKKTLMVEFDMKGKMDNMIKMKIH